MYALQIEVKSSEEHKGTVKIYVVPVFKHHTMKEWWNGGKIPYILKLDIWRCLVTIIQLVYSSEGNPGTDRI